MCIDLSVTVYIFNLRYKKTTSVFTFLVIFVNMSIQTRRMCQKGKLMGHHNLSSGPPFGFNVHNLCIRGSFIILYICDPYAKIPHYYFSLCSRCPVYCKSGVAMDHRLSSYMKVEQQAKAANIFCCLGSLVVYNFPPVSSNRIQSSHNLHVS